MERAWERRGTRWHSDWLSGVQLVKKSGGRPPRGYSRRINGRGAREKGRYRSKRWGSYNCSLLHARHWSTYKNYAAQAIKCGAIERELRCAGIREEPRWVTCLEDAECIRNERGCRDGARIRTVSRYTFTQPPRWYRDCFRVRLHYRKYQTCIMVSIQYLSQWSDTVAVRVEHICEEHLSLFTLNLNSIATLESEAIIDLD